MSIEPTRGYYDVLHFGRPDGVGDTPRKDLKGLHWEDTTGGDCFLGMDNLVGLQDFCTWKSVKTNSTTTDMSEVASYDVMGHWGSGATPDYPFKEIMWSCGDGSVGNYTFLGEDDTTYIRDGCTTIGWYDGSTYGGGGLLIAARQANCGVYHSFVEGTNGQYVIRTMSQAAPGKGITNITAIMVAGTRLNLFAPLTTAAVSNGNATYEWLDGSYSNDVRMRSLVADGDNSGVASTVSYTNVVDNSANSTGVGTVLFKGTTSRNSSGFLKIWDGTTARYIAYWDAITG